MATRLGTRPVLVLACAAVCLGGCSSLLTEGSSAGAGIAGAAIAHGVTRNAGVTTGIGLGVQAATRAGLQYVERRVHGVEQDRIAAAAGPLPIGGVAHWQVVHDIPIEADQHGEVTVTQAWKGFGFDCKEIVFSVDRKVKHDVDRHFYVADVCLDKSHWRWATAEPATPRWGALQ
jgi:hypothetical protein